MLQEKVKFFDLINIDLFADHFLDYRIFYFWRRDEIQADLPFLIHDHREHSVHLRMALFIVQRRKQIENSPLIYFCRICAEAKIDISGSNRLHHKIIPHKA